MKKAEKIRSHINTTKTYKVTELARKAGIKNLRLHLFLSGKVQLPDPHINALEVVLREVRYR